MLLTFLLSFRTDGLAAPEDEEWLRKEKRFPVLKLHSAGAIAENLEHFGETAFESLLRSIVLEEL